MDSSSSAKTIVSFALIAFISWAVVAVVAFLLVVCSNDAARVGQFGDFFGAFNCLLSSLAVAGALYAVVLQQNQMKKAEADSVDSARMHREVTEIQALSAYSQCLASCGLITHEKFRDLNNMAKEIRMEPTPPKPDFKGLSTEEGEAAIAAYAKKLEDKCEMMKTTLDAATAYHQISIDHLQQMTSALVALRELPIVSSKIPHPPESKPEDGPGLR